MRPTEEDPLLAAPREHTVDDDAVHLPAAIAGDPAAQAWLVQRWQDPVYRYARRMMGTDEDARDAAQDTLVKVLRKLDTYDPSRPFSAWVFGIARNTCIDEFRRRKRRAWDEPGDVVDTSPSPLQEAAEVQRADTLQQALTQLSPLYREVLVLYHFEHLKYAEIAETLDIPIGTVMNRIFRARQKLRAHFEELGGQA